MQYLRTTFTQVPNNYYGNSLYAHSTFIQVSSTEQEWTSISQEFLEKWNLTIV